ncbi:hypothetical protein HDU82_005085 [Entophlyctis luteolus]|nr:hypothetical protein HDU82_005085 [Entophlyctis luteolus]
MSVVAASHSAVPTAGPYVPVRIDSFPYQVCNGKNNRDCDWKATGALLDGPTFDSSSIMTPITGGMTLLSPASVPNRFYVINEEGNGYEQFYLKNKALSIDLDLSQTLTGAADKSNIAATQQTSHSCTTNSTGTYCDPWGCGVNTGSDSNIGPHSSVIDTTLPFTLVTKFYTNNNQASGELVNITQVYQQGSKSYTFPQSITPSYCTSLTWNPYYPKTGGLAAMSDALAKGITMIFSLWGSGDMSWLDGGNTNPRCAAAANGTNQFTFSNIKISNL